MITRGQHASAQIALDTILDLEPINIFLDRTATMRAITLKEQGHWRHDNPIDPNQKKQTNMEKITVKLKSTLENYYLKKTDPRKHLRLDINYKTEILARESIIDKEEKGYSCYTDGSKTDRLWLHHIQ